MTTNSTGRPVICVIAPCYNEEALIETFYAQDLHVGSDATLMQVVLQMADHRVAH